MASNLITSVLKPLGLVTVNNDYLKSIDDNLDGIKDGLAASTEVSLLSSQVIEELNEDKLVEATQSVLEFCNIDDEVAELKTIQTKLQQDDTIEAAVAVSVGPKLLKEIISSTKKELTEHADQISKMIPRAMALVEEIVKKTGNFKSDASKWSLGQRIGTFGALQNTTQKSQDILKTAKELKVKLATLRESLAEITA